MLILNKFSNSKNIFTKMLSSLYYFSCQITWHISSCPLIENSINLEEQQTYLKNYNKCDINKFQKTSNFNSNCLIILNNEEYNKTMFNQLVNNNEIEHILCTDGGSQVFYKEITKIMKIKTQNSQTRDNNYKEIQYKIDNFEYIKDINEQNLFVKLKGILGDLDSLSPSLQNFYHSINIPIIPLINQNKNDFEKTLEYAIEKMKLNNFLINGALGGRFDHTFANISITEKIMRQHQDVNIMLLGKETIMCVLRSGVKHRLKFQFQKVQNQNQSSKKQFINHKGCGLITFGKIQHVETTGLKWNLGQNSSYNGIQWGKFLSTSNQIIENQITIQAINKENTNTDKKDFMHFLISLI